MAAAAAETLLAQAQAAEAAGDRDRALALLHAVLRHDPAEPRALNTLGLAALRRGDPTAAAALLARAAAAAPQVAAIRVNQADAARAMGDAVGELACLEQAIALDAYLVPALIRKARLLEAEARAEEAVPVWQAVLRIVPPDDAHPPALAAALAHAHERVAGAAAVLDRRLRTALADVRAAAPAGATDRVDHGIAALLGQRRIHWPQPTDLLVPRLPCDEFFARGHFPWLDRLEAATPAIRTEADALLADDAGFAPYVRFAPGRPVNQWAELNHSPRWSALFFWKDGVRRPEVCARAPATAALLESLPRLDIPGKGPTAFLSRLAAGSRIPPHTGVTNCRSIVHLALDVPEGCGFRVGSEVRQWREGRAFVFDDSIEHEAWNDSDRDRLVLILDVWNPWLTEVERDLLRAYYCARTDSQATFGD